jgi:hypothetical protein
MIQVVQALAKVDWSALSDRDLLARLVFSDAGAEQGRPAFQVLFASVPGSGPLTHPQH